MVVCMGSHFRPFKSGGIFGRLLEMCTTRPVSDPGAGFDHQGGRARA